MAREIFEETGLDTEEITPLNLGSIYNWEDEVYEEHNFITFVKHGNIVLNEEHSKHKWLDIDNFIKKNKMG